MKAQIVLTRDSDDDSALQPNTIEEIHSFLMRPLGLGPAAIDNEKDEAIKALGRIRGNQFYLNDYHLVAAAVTARAAEIAANIEAMKQERDQLGLKPSSRSWKVYDTTIGMIEDSTTRARRLVKDAEIALGEEVARLGVGCAAATIAANAANAKNDNPPWDV
jgi:hypothetical protein